jgi:hypothetical protein
MFDGKYSHVTVSPNADKYLPWSVPLAEAKRLGMTVEDIDRDAVVVALTEAGASASEIAEFVSEYDSSEDEFSVVLETVNWVAVADW